MLSALEDDHLLCGHLGSRVGNAADTVAGLAPSGERHPVGAKCAVIIDHHRRRVEFLGRVEGDGQIFGKYTGLKSDRKRVRGRDRFTQLVVSVHAGDRAENLVRRRLGVAGRIDKDRRLQGGLAFAATTDQTRARGDGLFGPALDRSASAGAISGPTSVSAEIGSPPRSWSTRAANRSRNAALSAACT